MTVVLMDGFDTYNGIGANTGLQAKWNTQFSEIGGYSMVAGRDTGQGAQCAAAASHNYNAYRQLPANYASICMGVAVKFNALPTVTPTAQLQFWDTLSSQIGLTVLNNGAIQLERIANWYASGTILATSAAGVIVVGTWRYIEIAAVINGSTGSFSVYVDGALVLSATGVNTKSTANSFVNQIMIGCPTASGTGGTAIFDHLYVNDTNVALGVRRIETIYPSADTAQKDFTPDTGTVNFSRVNAAQVVTTGYVQASTVSNTDRYDLVDLAGAPLAIDAVQVVSYAQKTDAAARSIALQVKSGATISDGANFSLSTSYGKLERLLTTDPNTTGAWTASAVNALQSGPKVTV